MTDIRSSHPSRFTDIFLISGGAGGSVVASRLSEIFHWKVLLLENGPDEPAAAEVPMLYATVLGDYTRSKYHSII